MIPVLPQARVSLMVLLDVPSMSLTYWDGSLHTGALNIGTVKINDGLNLGIFDFVSLAQASTTDTYVFKTGGSGGTLVSTVVITYTDSTKATIANVTKT